MELVSLGCVIAFLLELNTKKCPWCDGDHWSVLGVPETKANSTEDISGLRALPLLRLYKENNELNGSVEFGITKSLPVVIIRCEACGYLYQFDYSYIRKKETPPEVDNG